MLPEMTHVTSLRALYAGDVSPLDIADPLAARMAAADDRAIFITAIDELRRQAQDLPARAPEPNSLPLWGVPFAAKDDIDVVGLPTTAGADAPAPTLLSANSDRRS